MLNETAEGNIIITLVRYVILSVLWLNFGNTVKYSLSPSGVLSAERLNLTVYPSSCHNTDTVYRVRIQYSAGCPALARWTNSKIWAVK